MPRRRSRRLWPQRLAPCPLAFQMFRLQRARVSGPSGIAIAAEFVEIVPAVEAGVVTVIEENSDGVVANRLQTGNLHVALPADDLLLRGPVSLHLGAWRFDTQIFGGQGKGLTGIERDGQRGFRLVEPHLCGPGPPLAHLPSRSSSVS